MRNNNTYIVAELSANHNKDINIAINSIIAAKKSGADAIKIQTYTADTMTINCKNEFFKIKGGTLWDGKTLYDLYKEAYTPWEWHSELKRVSREEGIDFFSTPFDISSVDFLETLNVEKYKIASFEITDIPLIKYIASKNKPIIISTGIATLDEIQDAIDTCISVGNNDITLLKCTSSYPSDLIDQNLLTILDMKKRFKTNIGLSDHTIGDIAATTAVSLGACFIEKHFILDRAIGGPDALFSAEPKEFSQMVNRIRQTEQVLGRISYEQSNSVLKNRKFSRSLFIVKDVKKGEKVSNSNVRSIRPGDGISPKYLEKIIGESFNNDYYIGTPLKFEMLVK